MEGQGLGGAIDSTRMPSPGRKMVNEPLATVTEVSEDRSGIEASMLGAAPSREPKAKSKADEIEAAEESKHCETEGKDVVLGVEGNADQEVKICNKSSSALQQCNWCLSFTRLNWRAPKP